MTSLAFSFTSCPVPTVEQWLAMFLVHYGAYCAEVLCHTLSDRTPLQTLHVSKLQHSLIDRLWKAINVSTEPKVR